MSDQQQIHNVESTRVEMTEVVLPQFTNALGNVFGGQIVSWIDICAAVAAQRHCRSVVVTASIDELHFIEPIKQGDVVILKGQVNAAFRTSMEIGVTVDSEDPLTGERRKAVKAYLTYVALDRHGRPHPVPGLVRENADDERRHDEATERRQLRLAQRAERIQKRT